MKGTVRFTFFLIAVIECMVALFSCNDVCSCKKESCPGYSNADFDNWFPYKTNDLIVFADSSGTAKSDTVSFYNVTESSSYEAERGCYNGASGCSQGKDINSAKFTLQYSHFTAWDGTTTNVHYDLILDTFRVSSDKFGANGFINPDAPSQFYSSLVVGEKSYPNVQVITNTDTAFAGNTVYQVYLQKGIGLLAYRYYPLGSLFVKQ